MTPAELGAALRGAGLHARALAAWAGTDRLSALGMVPAAPTRAGAALALFVAGAELPVELVRHLPLPALEAAGLVELAGGLARAPLAVLPLGEALLACDRRDAPAAPDLVCWPDDSSYHLARALPPARVATWIDLGCGSAFAALARPQLAARIAGTDLNPRAVEHARRGAALSGMAHLEAFEGDFGDGLPRDLPPAELVTCNAPIPGADDGGYRPLWRATGPDFVARAVDHAARALAPGGLIVIHAALDALAPVVAELPGERALVAYTPPDAPREFAVAWWRPAGEPRHVAARRPLTAARPHLEHADRLAALAGALAPL